MWLAKLCECKVIIISRSFTDSDEEFFQLDTLRSFFGKPHFWLESKKNLINLLAIFVGKKFLSKEYDMKKYFLKNKNYWKKKSGLEITFANAIKQKF